MEYCAPTELRSPDAWYAGNGLEQACKHNTKLSRVSPTVTRLRDWSNVPNWAVIISDEEDDGVMTLEYVMRTCRVLLHTCTCQALLSREIQFIRLCGVLHRFAPALTIQMLEPSHTLIFIG
jgi:hypothetical protein